jgi:hypothetical protein
MRACIEPLVDEATLQTFASYQAHPEATRQAFFGLPFVVIWHLTR